MELLYVLGIQKICVTCFIAIFALLWWSELNPQYRQGLPVHRKSKIIFTPKNKCLPSWAHPC